MPAPKGAIKLLATGSKEMVVKIPALNKGMVSSKVITKVPTRGGTIAICCDLLSCSVK